MENLILRMAAFALLYVHVVVRPGPLHAASRPRRPDSHT